MLRDPGVHPPKTTSRPVQTTCKARWSEYVVSTVGSPDAVDDDKPLFPGVTRDFALCWDPKISKNWATKVSILDSVEQIEETPMFGSKDRLNKNSMVGWKMGT